MNQHDLLPSITCYQMIACDVRNTCQNVLYHSGAFSMRCKKSESMHGMHEPESKGQSRNGFTPTTGLIEEWLMQCDWKVIVMRCYRTRVNMDSATGQKAN